METPVLNKGKRSRDQVSPLLQDPNKKANIMATDMPDINLAGDAPAWAKMMFRTMNDNHKELSDKLTKLSDVEIANLKIKNTVLEARISELEQSNQALRDRVIQQEVYTRRNNLLLHGIPEPTWETTEQCETTVRTRLSQLNVDVTGIKFDRLHRLGPKTRTDRIIIVRFNDSNDRELVWKARPGYQPHTGTRPTHFRITQDYPQEILARRRRLIPILNKAKQTSGYEASFLRDDKLTVNNVTYTVDTIRYLPEALDPRNIATKQEGNITAFWSQNSPLSNHHPSRFIIDGVRYNSVEQRYMQSMALHAKDLHRAHKVMSAEDPVMQKRVMQGLTKSESWKKAAIPAMKAALTAKFTQNPDLADFLLRTGESELVEAAPTDNFWGAGISMDSPQIYDKTNWKGKNMLGQMLVEVRTMLANQ
jgi:ribA/ribD-fused uncharacterized protein